MELLQLRYFYDSAAALSFARTADKYMVPTSSVSSSVRRLEKELGCPLFVRYANRIELSDEGRRLQKSLCLVFSELDAAVSALSRPAEDTRKIRMLVRAVRSQVTDRIVAFREIYPEIAFSTVLNFDEQNIEAYDIIIDTESPAYAGMERFELCSMRIGLRAAPDHPLAGKPVSLRALSDEPFISWGEGSNMQKILDAACLRAGFAPRVAVTVGDKECYEKLIRAGVGIGLGREDIPMKGTVELAVSDFDERYTVYVYCKSAACFGNVRKFVDFLRDGA